LTQCHYTEDTPVSTSGRLVAVRNNNNNNNNHGDIYSPVIMAELLQEFTRFTR